MAGRTLAIGDIHGCDYALATLLQLVQPTRFDTVVVLGDVVDRGPGTRQVIDQLLALRDTCEVVLVLGNHDQMMLAAAENPAVGLRPWLQHGGHATLFSYGGPLEAIPPRHLEFLRSGIDLFPTATELFVHANLEPGVPLYEQPPTMLRWTALAESLAPWDDGRRVICGHTSQRTHVPRVEAGWVCIDTACCRGGWLTALDVGRDLVYQANDQRRTRQFPLRDAAAFALVETQAEQPLPQVPAEADSASETAAGPDARDTDAGDTDAGDTDARDRDAPDAASPVTDRT